MVEQEQIGEKQVERIENNSPVTVTLLETTGLLAMTIIA